MGYRSDISMKLVSAMIVNQVTDILIRTMDRMPEGYGMVGLRPVMKGETYMTKDGNIAVAKFNEPTCPRPILKHLQMPTLPFFEDIE